MTDPLSELLSVAGVAGSLISRARLSRPFGVASSALQQAVFHTPRTGSCFVAVRGERAVEIHPGDVAVLPRGAAHDISHAAGVRCRPIAQLETRHADGKLPTVVNGGEPDLDLLCGTFQFGAPARAWLIDPLPELVVVRGHAAVAHFFDATLELMEVELARAGLGTRLVSDRLVEVLVVHLLRAWAEQADDAPGWLAGLADPHLGPVLAAVHAEPARVWDLERMARAAGLSRTRFVARFRERMGLPPGEFLITWRIAVARRALQNGAGVAQAAERAGYASEASFSRAFKRLVGLSPGAWRNTALPGLPVP